MNIQVDLLRADVELDRSFIPELDMHRPPARVRDIDPYRVGRTKHRATFEEATGYRVTENQKEAERAAWEVMDEEEAQEETAETPGTIPSVDNAFRGLPLRERLQEIMNRRKVSGAALASLFGVSKMTVSNWVSGKKPIPEDAVPLLVRWIESGTAPTAEELAARRSRRDET